MYTSEITTFNYLVESSGADYANFIDTLVEYDNYGVVKPCIAEDWSVSEDGLVWTFNIRKGIKWYSYKGEEKAETTANDFVTGENYVLDPKNASRVSNILYVLKNAEAYYDGTTTNFSQVGVKAIDEYTLEYTLEKPVPYFLSMITYTCFLPVSEQILLETGDRFGTSNDKIWYNGAFLLDVFEPQSKRVSLANKNYWDKENIFVKKVISTYNKEAETLAPELVLRGEVDYAVIPSSIVGEWLSDPAKADLIRPVRTGFTSYFYALTLIQPLTRNMNRKTGKWL